MSTIISTITVKLKPFSVPNFVVGEVPYHSRQDGLQEAPKYHLSELSAETLSEMCDEFRRSVFEKAKKDDPTKGENLR